MYAIEIDGIEYLRCDGEGFTLTAAMREVYGVAHARVLRADGTAVVASAGSASQVVHLPTGRTVQRRDRWRADGDYRLSQTWCR